MTAWLLNATKKSRTFGRDLIGRQIVTGLFQLPHKINAG